MERKKARSRLKKTKKSLAKSRLQIKKIQEKKNQTKIFSKNTYLKKIKAKKTSNKQLFKKISSWKNSDHQLLSKLQKQIAAHLRYSLALFLALICYYIIFLMLGQFYPEQIQNFLITNAYFPLFLFFFLANFFFFSFLFLNKKIAFFVSSVLNLLLFFRIQKVIFDVNALLITFFIALLIYAVFFLDLDLKKKKA